MCALQLTGHFEVFSALTEGLFMCTYEDLLGSFPWPNEGSDHSELLVLLVLFVFSSFTPWVFAGSWQDLGWGEDGI